MSDSELVRNILRGDESAFEELVRRYEQPLYGFAYRLADGDRDMAEDIVQDAFVKAWKYLKKFDTDKNFKTWLFTIAKNSATDRFRRKRDVPFALFQDTTGKNVLEEITEADVETAERLLERMDNAHLLDEALRQLSAAYQLLLVMHYREGLALTEIAEILGEPYNTVKSRHSRAVFGLRKAVLEGDASLLARAA